MYDFNLKVIFFHCVDLPHAYGHHPKKINLLYGNDQILHLVHKFIPIAWNNNV